jgi:transposase
MQQFVGIDWATRRARWCAVTPAGVVIDEGWAPADEDGLAGLVTRLGPEAVACMEMMSGAAWVRERLQAGGWIVQIADARKAKAVGSLAAKTDKLDARVLAELARRDLVPLVYVPTFADRELKECLGRRMHMVRLRTSAMNRAHGVMSQFGVTLAFVPRARRSRRAQPPTRTPKPLPGPIHRLTPWNYSSSGGAGAASWEPRESAPSSRARGTWTRAGGASPAPRPTPSRPSGRRIR